MAFQPLSSDAIDLKREPGKTVEGYFTGTTKIQTKLGDQVIWQFRRKDGSQFGVYGFTSLNRAMGNAVVGMMTRIHYRGKEMAQTKYGMKEIHKAFVEIDPEDTLAKPEAKTEDVPF